MANIVELSSNIEIEANGLAFGIVSIVFGAMGLVPGVGLIAAILGLLSGLIGRSRARFSGHQFARKISLIGIKLSTITLVVAAIYVVMSIGTLLTGPMAGLLAHH